MSIGIVIQARTGSQRLPNKMVLPFIDNKGILELLVHRLIESKIDIPIIISTTKNPKDDIICEICNSIGVFFYRGSEENVLSRFIDTANKFSLNKIVRICADNPFIDISALNHLIVNFHHCNSDYWAFCTDNSIPSILTHFGFWAEGVTMKALKQVLSSTDDKFYLEHVTNYIYSNSQFFEIHLEELSPIISREKNIRLTIDTYNDFTLAKEVYTELEMLDIPIKGEEIIKYIRKRPDLISRMRYEIKKNIK
jgi:spore coat polysaccharide biosynthesis protein SpsF